VPRHQQLGVLMKLEIGDSSSSSPFLAPRFQNPKDAHVQSLAQEAELGIHQAATSETTRYVNPHHRDLVARKQWKYPFQGFLIG
jgi:hypothetical protein